MGQERLYMVPKGLVKTSELPEHWGLLEVDKAGRVHVTQRLRCRFKTRVAEAELPYLFKALQYYQLDTRIGQTNPQTLKEKAHDKEQQ